MNIDFYGLFNFGDEDALRYFVMAHQFTHDYEASAIARQFNASIGTYEIGSQEIVEPWIAMMRGDTDGIPQPVSDWLQTHNDNHTAMLAFLPAAHGTIATDLSQVDFRDPAQMYEWLTVHQATHDYEQQALGLS